MFDKAKLSSANNARPRAGWGADLVLAREAVPTLIQWLKEERAQNLRASFYHHGGVNVRCTCGSDVSGQKKLLLEDASRDLGLEG